MNNNVFNLNIASLWENSQYAIVAVDCDGVSVTPEIIDRWPVVLITAPIDKNLGGTNPYAYKVPSRTDNPIRTLVFDPNAVSQVEYRVDGSGEWYPMSEVRLVGGSNSYLWETKEWDTTSLAPLEDHTLEVRATGSTIRSDIITFEISSAPPIIEDGDGNDGLCFITTAAYGSHMAKEVRVFERVRDEYLLGNELGRAFVSAYYKCGPRLAHWIGKHPVIRKIVRIGLYPILALSKWFVGEKPSE